VLAERMGQALGETDIFGVVAFRDHLRLLCAAPFKTSRELIELAEESRRPR